MTDIHRIEAPATHTAASEAALKMQEDAMDHRNIGTVKPNSTAGAHLTHLVISGDVTYSGMKLLANTVNGITHQRTLDSQAMMATVGDIGWSKSGLSYAAPSEFKPTVVANKSAALDAHGNPSNPGLKK